MPRDLTGSAVCSTAFRRNLDPSVLRIAGRELRPLVVMLKSARDGIVEIEARIQEEIVRAGGMSAQPELVRDLALSLSIARSGLHQVAVISAISAALETIPAPAP